MAPAFVRFGTDHLAALALTAALAVGLSVMSRRWPRGVAGGLAVALLATTVTFVVVESRDPRVSLWSFLPLHLCDMAIFVAAFALLTRAQAAYEVLFMWALSGTLLAMVFPEVYCAFPDWYFVTYFLLHGGVVLAALVLTFGVGLRPRRSAPLHVLGWTAVYAGGVGLLNWVFDTNYLYLCRRPSTPSPLDWFGPWPWYIVGAAGIALVFFTVMTALARSVPGQRADQPGPAEAPPRAEDDLR